MCKVISIISCKGGVGKTTSAVNISSFLQMEGNRVCVIDFDSQHNLSNHFGIFPGHLKNRPTIYDLLHSSINFDDEKCLFESIDNSIYKTNTVDVIPSTMKLSDVEVELAVSLDREHQLEYIISYLKDKYDYIFIDCHPGLDLFAINALVASDSVIIPVEAHIYSADGLNQVMRIIENVKRRLNPKLNVEGIIITKFQKNTNCCKHVSDYVMSEYGSSIKIFNDYIKYTIKLADAPIFGMSIHEYSPKSDVAQSYARIAQEVAGNGRQ